MARTLSTAEGMPAPASIAFAGGGTAGHVFPGLAVAAELDRRVVWLGSARGVEKGLVTEAGIVFLSIPAGKLRRYFSFRTIVDVVKIAAGIVASFVALRSEKPALLFSKGGFVSVPPVVAAWLCGIPSWTHESDVDPGLATRINLRFCEKVLVSFPQTVDYLPAGLRAKAVVTGNPVRQSLYTADPERGRKFVGCEGKRPLLFVIGGSLGSSFLNGLIAACLDTLLGRFFIVHQMGASQYVPSDRTGYHAAAFFKAELPDVMACADLVISRAGANTLAELAALGKPSLLIPLPVSSSRGDQLLNAEMFRSRGASIVLSEEDATPGAFTTAIRALFDDPARLPHMGRQALGLGAGRPAVTIAKLIRERLG
jgi:UDP-N-acetylglucosamine--N-acetylmuramyl-(pentapeptide) pyrophosphoryl-undecaprenol N-acetylglucosamine transferase